MLAQSAKCSFIFMWKKSINAFNWYFVFHFRDAFNKSIHWRGWSFKLYKNCTSLFFKYFNACYNGEGVKKKTLLYVPWSVPDKKKFMFAKYFKNLQYRKKGLLSFFMLYEKSRLFIAGEGTPSLRARSIIYWIINIINSVFVKFACRCSLIIILILCMLSLHF